MMKKILSALSLVTILAATGCASLSTAKKQEEYPKSPEEARRARVGSLFGSDGFKLFSGNLISSSKAGSMDNISINGYLWRSALDTVSFMPLASADPVGGVIITDWYEDPAAKGERFKANVVILSKDLRSDAVKVSVFKQSNRSGSWRDSEVSGNVARDLENKILTRARELRIGQDNT